MPGRDRYLDGLLEGSIALSWSQHFDDCSQPFDILADVVLLLSPQSARRGVHPACILSRECHRQCRRFQIANVPINLVLSHFSLPWSLNLHHPPSSCSKRRRRTRVCQPRVVGARDRRHSNAARRRGEVFLARVSFPLPAKLTHGLTSAAGRDKAHSRVRYWLRMTTRPRRSRYCGGNYGE